MQHCGVVAHHTFINPLQVKTGSEEGQWKVPIVEIAGIPAETILYLCGRFFERGDGRAVTHPADFDERLVYFVPICKERERHIAGQGCICIWAGLYFTWRRCEQRTKVRDGEQRAFVPTFVGPHWWSLLKCRHVLWTFVYVYTSCDVLHLSNQWNVFKY